MWQFNQDEIFAVFWKGKIKKKLYGIYLSIYIFFQPHMIKWSIMLSNIEYTLFDRKIQVS
jgi:hypothetical protein